MMDLKKSHLNFFTFICVKTTVSKVCL